MGNILGQDSKQYSGNAKGGYSNISQKLTEKLGKEVKFFQLSPMKDDHKVIYASTFLVGKADIGSKITKLEKEEISCMVQKSSSPTLSLTIHDQNTDECFGINQSKEVTVKDLRISSS